MKSNIRLQPGDLKIKQENALEMFYAGIKSHETRKTMDRNLKKFLTEVCGDILKNPTYESKAQEFVELAKSDQEKVTSILLAYTRRLKEKCFLEKSDPNYLNPSTIPNRIKPIKKLLEMNGLGIPWKRIYSTYPEQDSPARGRGYTREEIKKLLEYSDSLATDFIILASSSGGLRVGAWENQKWENVFPVYLTKEGSYKIGTPDHHKENQEIYSEDVSTTVACAAMMVYKDTPDEYVALISSEAWDKLQEYKKVWIAKMKRRPTDSDSLLLERFSKPVPMSSTAVKRKIERLVYKSGIRKPLIAGRRRHEVPATHGFRRYWDKIMMQVQRKRGTLSALVIKERLLGHEGLVKTDKNYFWTDVQDLVPEYLAAMPHLMISDEQRLKQELDSERVEKQKLLKSNMEKDEALKQIHEMKVKIERIQKYHVKNGS